MIRTQIVQILEENRGRHVSGAMLAQRLGVSRNAVWKAVTQLRQSGRQIEAIQNRGYRLIDSQETLSRQRFLQALGARSDDERIQVIQQVDSTNLELKRLAENGAPEGTVLLAASQTAGRGRLGRSFYSPDQTGLYLSVLFRPKIAVSQAVMLTAAAAVAVLDAVKALCGLDAQIKWVNDLYLNGRKICGILTEAALDCETGSIAHAVVGIGVNIQRPSLLPEELEPIVGGLLDGREVPEGFRELLAGRIVQGLTSFYRALPQTPFMERYREKNMILGRRVRISSTGQVATAEAIDDAAGLVVRFEDGNRQTLTYGEVSVLPV